MSFAPRPTPGERLHTAWPEILVFLVALAFRASLLLRLHGSILDGSLVADEQIYWNWSAHILRAGPIGPHPFFMGPLYPYWLALLRLAPGIRTVFGVLAVQALLGSFACSLLTNAARRLTSATLPAVIAGLMSASYEMAIFHDSLVLTESLLFFLAACLVWTAVLAVERGCSRVHAITLGVLVGLLSQGRALFALLLFALWPVVRAGHRARFPSRMILAAGAFAVTCVPAAWHNLRVSDSFIPFTYNLGMNFYIGNHDGASGSWAIVTTHERPDAENEDTQGGVNYDGTAQLEADLGRPVGASESSREWMHRGLRFWGEKPIDALRITALKLGMVLSHDELPQLESPHVFERLIGFIGLLPFWLVALVAFPSVLRRPVDAATCFLVASVLLLAVGTALFFVVDRYRLHLVPFLVPLAATTLARVARLRSVGAIVPEVARVALTAVLISVPVPHPTPQQSAWALESDIGDRYAYAHRFDVALEWYARAEARVKSGAVTTGTSLTGSGLLEDFEQNVAGVALASGDTTRAITALIQASELSTEPRDLREEVALLLAVRGRSSETRRFLVDERRRTVAFEALARAATALGSRDTAKAADWIQAAVLLDSSGVAPREARIRLAIERNRLDEAGGLLRREAALLGASSATAHRALLALLAGERERARILLTSIPEGTDFTPPTRLMVDWLRSQLGPTARPIALRVPPDSR